MFHRRKTLTDRALKIIAAAIGIFISMVTTGCWDLKETQDRNFVLLAAIDDADIAQKSASDEEKARTQTFVQKYGDKEYMLSLQLLKLAKAESKGGGAQAERTFVISNTGKSLFEMVRDMLGQSSKSLYFEHLATIVVSEAAVKKNGLQPIFDFFRRDPEMRWRTRIFITPGDAITIAKYNPPTGEPGGRYLEGLVKNNKKDAHIAGIKNDLGYITQAIDNGVDYTIPRLDYVDNVPKVGGVALFKNNRLVGYADEYLTRGLKFIYGTEKSAVIPVKCPMHPDDEVVFELFKHETKLSPHIEGESIYFTLDITMQGNIGEFDCKYQHNMHDYAFLHAVEQAIAAEVSQNAQETWKFEQQLGVDTYNIKARFKGYHPFAWQKIKDRWAEIYPSIPLIVSVHVNIRAVGEHD